MARGIPVIPGSREVTSCSATGIMCQPGDPAEGLLSSATPGSDPEPATLPFDPHSSPGGEVIRLVHRFHSLGIQANDLGVLKNLLSWTFTPRDSESGLGAPTQDLYFFWTPVVILRHGHTWEPKSRWSLWSPSPSSSVGRGPGEGGFGFGAELHGMEG